MIKATCSYNWEKTQNKWLLSQQSRQKRFPSFPSFPNPEIESTWPTAKCRGRKFVFWHVILHSYLCNALFKFFIKIKSNQCSSKTYSEIKSTWRVKSSKEEIVLSRDSFMKVSDQNRKQVEARNQRTGTPAEFTVPW